jgi:hypothetical protein
MPKVHPCTYNKSPKANLKILDATITILEHLLAAGKPTIKINAENLTVSGYFGGVRDFQFHFQ